MRAGSRPTRIEALRRQARAPPSVRRAGPRRHGLGKPFQLGPLGRSAAAEMRDDRAEDADAQGQRQAAESPRRDMAEAGLVCARCARHQRRAAAPMASPTSRQDCGQGRKALDGQSRSPPARA